LDLHIGLRLVLRKHQLAILHRNLATRVAVHLYTTHLASEIIFHVITDNLVVRIGYGTATRFGGGVGTAGLHFPLHLITGVTTANRPCNRRNLLAVTSTYLITKQTTDYRTNCGSGYAMLILHWLLASYRDVLAHLTRRFDRFLNWLNRQNLGKFRPAINQTISSESAASRGNNHS